MWTLLLAPAALAAHLVVDARVPVEIWVAGELAAQAVQPCELRFELPSGEVELGLVIGGRLQQHEVVVPENGSARVVVGRTGVTTDDRIEPDAADEEPPAVLTVQLRSAAREEVSLVVGTQRLTLAPREVRDVELTPGRHALTVRNANGTVMWARGTLEVESGGVVVQVTDGRMPEVSGSGGRFHPDAR